MHYYCIQQMQMETACGNATSKSGQKIGCVLPHFFPALSATKAKRRRRSTGSETSFIVYFSCTADRQVKIKQNNC